MKRLMENTVFSGLVTCWRLAGTPTSRSPPCVKATTEGVVRPPSRLGITVGSPPSSTAMQELVVPRSIPIVLPILVLPPGEGGVPSKLEKRFAAPLAHSDSKKSKSQYGRSNLARSRLGVQLPGDHRHRRSQG